MTALSEKIQPDHFKLRSNPIKITNSFESTYSYGLHVYYSKNILICTSSNDKIFGSKFTTVKLKDKPCFIKFRDITL